ncbi:MAG: hypothetical protein ACI4U4_05380 [Bacilli bacterium]
MKETLICSLEKHNIYYLNDANVSFYLFVPYKEFNDTNISIRLKSNYQTYDLTKNSIETVTNELINYYKNLDNYNVTLILPVFYDDILNRVRIVDDMELYQRLDRYLGYIFNSAYLFLTKCNIKVNSNIYVINNDSFNKFTNWFVSRYSNRIEYKTILELVKENGTYNSYNVIETPNINFVVGKDNEPTIDKTIEMELETFDNIAREVSKENSVKREPRLAESGGFVSYILLGIITFIVSIALLYFFIK